MAGVASPALDRALKDAACGRPLPEPVADVLIALNAPPRLAAHLRLVHDTAVELTAAIAKQFPGVPFDREAVLFGAATHDIGKCFYPNELSGPGSAHEMAGYELLLSHGYAEHLARFARTHASWAGPGIELEDLLVSLADKVWKGKRAEDLEQLAVSRLAGDRTPWEAFMALDDLLIPIASKADKRLAAQGGHGLT
ncbi:HD domain-containing protein [Catelliglobosispora koreensis]|uniref:HD domain-containing protein n=1 Tax=Catelliglobosispora koreensis TaxID=129052 RepID=UPI0003A93D7C